MEDDFIARYCAELQRQGRSMGTVAGYVADLQLFIRWQEQSIGEAFTPTRVVPLDVRSYRGHLQTVVGLAPATINRRLQALRSFFRWAHAQGLVREDPATGIEAVVTTRQQYAPKALTSQQVNRMLRQAQAGRHAKRDYALLQIMLQAGLRVGEVATLRVDDVELHERSGKARIRAGKGGKERSVPLNATVRKALDSYLTVRPAVTGVDQFFVSQKGRAMTVRAIEGVVEECARRAGLEVERITAHMLRHTFAARFLEAHSGQLVELAALLGHADLNTTALYTQPSFADVAAKLEALPSNVDG
jgi:integrase/recombinase XerC